MLHCFCFSGVKRYYSIFFFHTFDSLTIVKVLTILYTSDLIINFFTRSEFKLYIRNKLLKLLLSKPSQDLHHHHHFQPRFTLIILLASTPNKWCARSVVFSSSSHHWMVSIPLTVYLNPRKHIGNKNTTITMVESNSAITTYI